MKVQIGSHLWTEMIVPEADRLVEVEEELHDLASEPVILSSQEPALEELMAEREELLAGQVADAVLG